MKPAEDGQQIVVQGNSNDFMLNMAVTLLDCLHKPEEVATPEDVLKASLAELERLPVDVQQWIEPDVRRLSQDGKCMVFVGDQSPRSNLIYTMMGAHHRQVGPQINIFFVSAERYRNFILNLNEKVSQSPIIEIQAVAAKALEDLNDK